MCVGMWWKLRISLWRKYDVVDCHLLFLEESTFLTCWPIWCLWCLRDLPVFITFMDSQVNDCATMRLCCFGNLISHSGVNIIEESGSIFDLSGAQHFYWLWFFLLWKKWNICVDSCSLVSIFDSVNFLFKLTWQKLQLYQHDEKSKLFFCISLNTSDIMVEARRVGGIGV